MDGTRNPGSSPVLVAFSVGSAGSGGQSGGWPPAPLATRQAPLSMIDGANNTFPSGLMIKQWPCLGWIQIQLPLLSRKQQPPLMSGNLSRSSRTRKLQRRQRRRAKPSRIVLGPRAPNSPDLCDLVGHGNASQAKGQRPSWLVAFTTRFCARTPPKDKRRRYNDLAIEACRAF